MPTVSCPTCGIADYRVKRDWRRFLDREIRSEGYVPFRPNTTIPAGLQALPNYPETDEDINLITQVRNPNGKFAFICGTKTKLWRYFGLEEGGYAEDYVEDDYVDDNPGEWILIGSGFSPNGRRWESYNINGYLVLNNGVDLPMTYRFDDFEVKPIYELRENGVAAVDTISELNGILYLCGIKQITEEKSIENLSLIDSGVITAAQTGSQSSWPITVAQEGYLRVDYDAGERMLGTPSIQLCNPSAFSYRARIRVNESSLPDGLSETIIAKSEDVNTSGYSLGIWNDSGTLKLMSIIKTVVDGTPTYDILGTAPISTGVWYDVAVTFDTATHSLYVNGALDGSVAVAGLLVPNSHPFTVGKPVNGGTEVTGLKIDFDNVDVWNRCLAAGEVGTMVPTSAPGLVANWRFDSLTDGITPDSSGYGFDATVTAAMRFMFVSSAPLFNVGMEGKTLITSAGESRVLSWFLGTNRMEFDGESTVTDDLLCYIQNGDQDYTVVASDTIFTEDMVGANIIWDSGEIRQITGFLSGTVVEVDTYAPIPSGLFGIQNLASYAAYTDAEFIDHIQYRIANGTIDEPRRWAGQFVGSIVKGSQSLRLQYPVKSIEAGMEILIVGAGTNGGNLISQVQYISESGTLMSLVSPALTTVVDTPIQAADAEGSMVSYFDLQDDSSAIVKAMPLGGVLVIHKETSIFTGRYTGVASSPMAYDRVYPGGETRGSSGAACYFRNTLINVTQSGQTFQMYAGRNAWYRFDLVNRTPIQIEAFDVAGNLFFDQASIEDTESIFTADNPITNEIAIVFPSRTQDKMLRYDYDMGTLSTSSMEVTAACSVLKPVAGIPDKPVPDWFVMALPGGSLVRYGALNMPELSGSGSKVGTTVHSLADLFTPDHVGYSLIFGSGSIYPILEYVDARTVTVADSMDAFATTDFRLVPSVWSRSGDEYESTIESGLDAMGDSMREKQVERYVPELATQSLDTPIKIDLLAARNISEGPTVVGTRTLNLPTQRNLVTCNMSRLYIGDRLTVAGKDNPIELISRTWMMAGVNTKGFSRRE